MMKRLITNSYILLALSMLIFTLVEDVIAEQIRDHRDAQPQEERVLAQRGSAEYLVTWFKPSRMPADLEDWLNTRMTGFALVAVAKDDRSGRYNSFFTKLPHGSKPWNYKVIIVPETSIEEALKRAPTQGWRLVAVSSEWHEQRGWQYICFFWQP
jgi:hypothetical protein